ncbi:gamma-glutamyltranspeptidase [Ancylostoma ceylanicum]|uniref:Gamma-glutamyltranspeptidase n=1 Tax=Ancylostoma ceylanicum TaxID=53326 RepID=A0A0D6M703_9BILA|nr:gamma-glutamyltranspeptidase [Ancylostoma ceylanicum]
MDSHDHHYKNTDILIRDGNAVDAAIATVVCIGAVHPYAAGFGGGLADKETVVINAGSVAPRTAKEETFLNNPNLAELGYSSIATPGFLHGIWTAYKKFGSGRISWQDILQPSAILLERGLSGLLTKADLAGYEAKIEPPLSTTFPNGYTIKGPASQSSFLAIGLIVEIMMGRYTNGSETRMDVSYLRDLLMAQRMGLVRLEQIGDPEFTIHDIVTEAMGERRNNTLEDSEEDVDDVDDIDVSKLLWNLHEDSVGSHINVIDREGMAVSLSSTINDRFGSVRRSEKSGFVWNNAMSGFTIYDKEDSEDTHVNAVEGRKRPRTSMAPFMLFDPHGQLVGCFGTTGSLNSILGVAQALLHRILFDMDITTAVDAPRIFATSEGATFESGFPLALLSELRNGMSVNPMLLTDSVVHSLERSQNGSLRSVCDFRDGNDQCARGY